jgi:dihydroorotate dehydrogenase electron transfer subunit
MQKRFDKLYKIISNKKIRAQYFELKVKAGADIVKVCNPGQFFMISVPGVFLRRPFSIHDAKNAEVSFLYKIAGKGTKILSEIKSGQIKMLGPLGNGYKFPLKTRNPGCAAYPVIIAGGTGIASLHFLAAKLKEKGTLYYGARSKEDLLCVNKFKEIGWKIVVSTEDGSKGHKGFVTDLLCQGDGGIDINSSVPLTLYICGPASMMKAVFKIAKEKNITGYASLEEKMACGIGICQGCAVRIKGENKMTCKDGPVFNIEEIEI